MVKFISFLVGIVCLSYAACIIIIFLARNA